jgi:hypothetical protein
VARFGLSVRKIEFLESPADYNDLVVGSRQEGDVEAVVRYLEETAMDWDIVDLRSLRDSGNTIRVLEQALSNSSLFHRVIPETLCPYLPIDSGPSEIIGRFSHSFRGTLRNQQSRLNRLSSEGLRVRIIEHPEAEPLLMEKLIALERLKLVDGKPIPSLFGDAPKVFQTLFDTLGPQGWIYAALMELGDRPIAFQVGFRCGNALWDYSKAYDPEYSRLSPGTMLIPAVLEYGYSGGYREYDFLRGEEPYKLRWSTGFHSTWRVIVWNRSRISRVRKAVYMDLKDVVYRFGRP